MTASHDACISCSGLKNNPTTQYVYDLAFQNKNKKKKNKKHYLILNLTGT